jgi:hypothetical protein
MLFLFHKYFVKVNPKLKFHDDFIQYMCWNIFETKGADPNKGKLFSLAHEHFLHHGYDANMFKLLLAGGLRVRETTVHGRCGGMTVLEAAEKSGIEDWINDVYRAMKNPRSMIAQTRDTVVKQVKLENEKELPLNIQEILQFELFV